MTKIAIQPNASGSGVFTIAAPNSNTNRTFTLPDATGEVLTDAENNPAKLFRRDNILGTVSQSGGVPTGAIIERGSNANGEFVKFADGTMQCWHLIADTGPNPRVWTYPAAFSSVPVAHATPRFGGPRMATVEDVTATGLNAFRFTDSGSFSGAFVMVFAIGRWK